MPTPLTWNKPGLKWNTPGATWNGTAASPPQPRPKAMSHIKAVIDFSNYTATELGPVAQHIHDQMTEHATAFPAPPVAMADLQTLIDDYAAALAARESRATSDVIAFNVARDELEEALGELGAHVNLKAKGDATLVDQSGFPSYDTARTVDTSPPAAPTDLRLRHGDVSGSIVARYKPQRQPSTNEVQINTGNPATESDWHTAQIIKGGKAILSGLTPGANVWVRVRTVGLKGVMGAWSDPGQIRVV
jgi:hypothetical protein